MFTTDTIVYPFEQNQNRYENGLAPVNTEKFTSQKNLLPRNQTGLIGLRFGTCVNVAQVNFVGRRMTQFFYQIKIFEYI